MTSRLPACLALPGAGTALGVVAGAVEEIARAFDIRAAGGTSGGGLVALALAFGMPPKNISEMCSRFLARKDLLDVGMPWDGGTGLFRGKKIEGVLRDIFGNTRMGNLTKPARVGVASLWTRRVGVVCSEKHPDVFVWRAARATMAIEGVFDAVRLREDNARLYGDGGVGLNVPAGIWDDRAERTIVVRFTHQQPVHTIAALTAAVEGGADAALYAPVRSRADVPAAAFDLMMDAASASFPSRKQGNIEIVLDSDADGLKFGLTRDEIDARHADGVMSARAALMPGSRTQS